MKRKRQRNRIILVGVGMYRYPEPITVEKVMSLLNNYASLDTGYDIIFKQVTGSSIPDMRGAMVEILMGEPLVSHALFIDDDMNFPVGQGFDGEGKELAGFNPLDHLMKRDKDVIGALCFSRDKQVLPFAGSETDEGLCLMVSDPDVIKSATPWPVDFLGFGCVLIKRVVFEKIAMSNGLAPGKYGAMFHATSNWRYESVARRAFKTATDEYERTLFTDRSAARERLADAVDVIQTRADRCLDDYSFCRRARDAGCEIWCDPSFDVTHIGRYEYGRMDWLAQDAVKSKTEGALQE